jgi:hypothetical protein
MPPAARELVPLTPRESSTRLRPMARLERLRDLNHPDFPAVVTLPESVGFRPRAARRLSPTGCTGLRTVSSGAQGPEKPPVSRYRSEQGRGSGEIAWPSPHERPYFRPLPLRAAAGHGLSLAVSAYRRLKGSFTPTALSRANLEVIAGANLEVH